MANLSIHHSPHFALLRSTSSILFKELFLQDSNGPSRGKLRKEGQWDELQPIPLQLVLDSHWNSSSPSSTLHSRLPSPSTTTCAGLSGPSGGRTQTLTAEESELLVRMLTVSFLPTITNRACQVIWSHGCLHHSLDLLQSHFLFWASLGAGSLL